MRKNISAIVLLGLVVAGLTVNCRKGPTSPDAACGSGPMFTVLPVSASAISAATPIGNLGPPTHTLPTDHVGVYLTGAGLTLSAPAAFRITNVRTTRYLSSPFRTGLSDHSVLGTVCSGVQVLFGHITTVVGKIASETGSNCQTYSTSDETVESCLNDRASIAMTAGEVIGTVGGPTAGAFDFGVYNSGHSNGFVNAARYSSMTNTAVCPYDPFASDLRSQIDARMGEPGRPSSGESPLCGTMAVDIAGTARGAWVLQSDPVNQAGNETNFAVLAPHPLYQQTGQALSLGPSAIGDTGFGGLRRYPVATSGRVNRQFRDVTGDGTVFCYVHDAATATVSYFVRLDGAVLSIQRVNHAAGATPCSADPSTWAMNSAALGFIR